MYWEAGCLHRNREADCASVKGRQPVWSKSSLYKLFAMRNVSTLELVSLNSKTGGIILLFKSQNYTVYSLSFSVFDLSIEEP